MPGGAGQDGDFCKHAVAVALSWLENNGEESFPPEEYAAGKRAAKPRKKRKTQADTLAEYLNTLSESALKDWLMEAAARDKGLRDKLLLKARAAGGGGKSSSGLAALRGAVLKTARQSVFLDWRQAGDFAERLHDAANLIEERIPLSEPGLPGIIEEAIQQAETSLENVDDSNGAVQEALHRLGAAHLNACLASRPDPVELAGRLFHAELSAEWDFNPSTLPHYAKALGRAGLTRYRQLLLEAVDRPVAKQPKVIGLGGLGGSIANYSLERMVERLCEYEGDDTLMLQVLEKDLSSAYRYLQVAVRHLKAGRKQQALDWAERGLAAYSDGRDGRLTDFAIALHRKQGDAKRADELAWTQFTQRPDFGSWQRPLGHTPKAWHKEITQRAIALLEQRMQGEERAPKTSARSPAWSRPAARSELIRIHLHLKPVERVWELANGHAIDGDLWPKVAHMRGETHPDQAISIYRQLLPEAIRRGQGNARYDEAYELVSRIRALRINQRQQEQFRQELAELRREYKAKRNFIKRLESLG